MKNFLIDSGNICAAEEGEGIQVIGKLERRVINSFEGRLWLVSKQIERLDRTQEIENSRTQDRDLVDNFRESLVLIYKKSMPEPEAGLVAGVVLGYKNDIGQDFYDQMVKSGTIHIVVASGYNILLVGGAILSLSFWLVSRRLAVWLAILTMASYAVLAGGEPPVVRAVWMASLLYLGQAWGRTGQSWWMLLLTAWVMLMIQPSLMASVSFQLSLAASFGLVVAEPWIAPRLTRALGSGLVDWTQKIGLMTTISTMMMTLPIIWWHFGRMSLIGILSNILILPLVPPIMILGVGGLLLPELFSWTTYAVAHWVVLMIQFFGS